MKAIIFLNGDLADPSAIKSLISDSSLLIGCDGGTNHLLAMGLKPAVIIGDFDSLAAPKGLRPDGQPRELNGTVYIRHPEDKDFTDSELAIKYAVQAGCGEIIVAGAFGNRLDHSLGNLLLLGRPEFAGLELKLTDGRQEAYRISGRAVIKGRKGDTISFMAVFGEPEVRASRGLKYDLSQHRLSLQANLGISNILLAKTAEVDLAAGSLLVIRQLQA